MEKVFKMKMPAGLYERVRGVAYDQHRSMADCVREAVEAWLKRNEGRPLNG